MIPAPLSATILKLVPAKVLSGINQKLLFLWMLSDQKKNISQFLTRRSGFGRLFCKNASVWSHFYPKVNAD